MSTSRVACVATFGTCPPVEVSFVYHLAAFTVLVGQTVDTDAPAITDDILTIQNSHFVLQRPMQLYCAAAMSTTIARARLASAGMRQIANPYIRPTIAGSLPGGNPNTWLLWQNPFTINPFEEIQCLATSNLGMSTERFTALMWLMDQYQPWPSGNIYPLRFTSTTAAVANAWTTLTLTWQDTIPSGLYTLVLSEMVSTNAQAHRWILSNQISRPGMFSNANDNSRLLNDFYNGALGSMGIFRSNDLPRLQVLVNGTDASHEGFAWAVRTGNI